MVKDPGGQDLASYLVFRLRHKGVMTIINAIGCQRGFCANLRIYMGLVSTGQNWSESCDGELG